MKADALALVGFLILTVGGGALIGTTVETGGWYADLSKPAFNPPGWAFPIAWGLLYILIALAGWRVWRNGELEALRLWWLQLALNFAWPPLFFGAHLLGPAFLLILALIAVIALFLRYTWNRDRRAALLFAPYAGWVIYAGLLNGSIWWLN